MDEVVDTVVDEAMKLVQEAFNTGADESRLLQLERRVEHLIELAAELDDVKTTAHKIQETEVAMELRESLQASREEGREVLRLLVGEEWLTVVSDPAAPGGYWVRGTAQLPVDLPVGGRGSEGTLRVPVAHGFRVELVA